MGYACPVCGVPQRDAHHLANHLAFTALTYGSDHEEWLDEHAPGWAEEGPEELAARAVVHAEETEYEEVFEDTVGGPDGHELFDPDQGSGHDHGDGHDRGHGPSDPPVDAATARRRGDGDLDPEAQSIIQEAQAMTRKMLDPDAAADSGSDDDSGSTSDDDSGSGSGSDAEADGDDGGDAGGNATDGADADAP